jgi:hypothetical protein
MCGTGTEITSIYFLEPELEEFIKVMNCQTIIKTAPDRITHTSVIIGAVLLLVLHVTHGCGVGTQGSPVQLARFE